MGIIVIIPLFIWFKNLGWVNTYMPLIVPAWFGGAFYIFLLRQFFMTIPQELSDAARIDGASEFRSFYQIILPLAKPALATVLLFEFLARWRDFLGEKVHDFVGPLLLSPGARYRMAASDGGVTDPDNPDHHPLFLHATHVHSGHHADGY